MKKITLCTAAAVSLTIFSTMSMNTEAANINIGYDQVSCKNRIVLSDTNTTEIQSLLNSIKEQQGNNCRTITIPCLPSTECPVEKSGSNKPEAGLPEIKAPEVSRPETKVPEQNAPDTKIPDTKVPDTKVPDTKETGEKQQLTYAEQVVNLVNAERAKYGLKPLAMKEDVRAAAQVRTSEIQTSFSHTRPDGRSFVTALQEQNVSYRGAGENIAWGQRTPEQVMEAWMNSEGHRANILNAKYTSIGVGYYQNAKGVNYWTQLFTY